MRERRGSRLLVEVGFLVALAAAVSFADLHPYVVVVVMLAGWLLAATFEWGALRARPHYGRGLPPRWYTPRVSLPPPRPLEQFSAGYPAAEAASDAPTWIAPPSMLAEWPVADVESDEALPEVPLPEPVDEQTHVHDVVEAEFAAADVPEPGPEPEPELELEPVPPEAEVEEPEPVAASAAAAVRSTSSGRTARHRIDPLAQPAAKSRRFGRRSDSVTYDAEVPEGPPPGRVLPTQARGED